MPGCISIPARALTAGSSSTNLNLGKRNVNLSRRRCCSSTALALPPRASASQGGGAAQRAECLLAFQACLQGGDAGQAADAGGGLPHRSSQGGGGGERRARRNLAKGRCGACWLGGSLCLPERRQVLRALCRQLALPGGCLLAPAEGQQAEESTLSPSCVCLLQSVPHGRGQQPEPAFSRQSRQCPFRVPHLRCSAILSAAVASRRCTRYASLLASRAARASSSCAKRRSCSAWVGG